MIGRRYLTNLTGEQTVLIKVSEDSLGTDWTQITDVVVHKMFFFTVHASAKLQSTSGLMTQTLKWLRVVSVIASGVIRLG